MKTARKSACGLAFSSCGVVARGLLAIAACIRHVFSVADNLPENALAHRPRFWHEEGQLFAGKLGNIKVAAANVFNDVQRIAKVHEAVDAGDRLVILPSLPGVSTMMSFPPL